MNTVDTPLDEFFAESELAFRFLEEQYGFVKQSSAMTSHPNPFTVRYENASTAVMIEGVSWGSGAVVSVGKKEGRPGPSFELVPLWTIARLEGAGQEEALTVQGQSAQMKASAAALPRLAGAALRGDFSVIEAARNYLEERLLKASKA
jgi:hypothetical protein